MISTDIQFCLLVLDLESRNLNSPFFFCFGIISFNCRLLFFFHISDQKFQLLFWQGFTSSRTLLADSSDATPVSSPFAAAALAIESGKSENEKQVRKRSKVQAVLKGIKQV